MAQQLSLTALLHVGSIGGAESLLQHWGFGLTKSAFYLLPSGTERKESNVKNLNEHDRCSLHHWKYIRGNTDIHSKHSLSGTATNRGLFLEDNSGPKPFINHSRCLMDVTWHPFMHRCTQSSPGRQVWHSWAEALSAGRFLKEIKSLQKMK